MKKLTIAASFITLALPTVVFAQVNLQNLIFKTQNILTSLIPIVIILALLAFFWGLVKYIWSSGEGHEEGKKVMIAGIVALFVMVSVWGIIRAVQSTLGIGSDSALPAPGVPR